MRYQGAVLRGVFVVGFLLVIFMLWLGRIGVAIGGGGLLGAIVLAAVRGWLGQRRLEAAMREADASVPPPKPSAYR